MFEREGDELNVATILIVDDRPANRDFLVTLLGYGGHRLLQAADGAEALAAARAEHCDLVIADILMPTMDGYELVRQLRSDPALTAVPVIFYTAHYREREAESLARSCGVAHVLTKPCEPDVILRTVEAALGAAPLPAPPAPELEFDREHLRLLTDKLSQKAEDLTRVNARLTALVDLGLDLGSERDPRKLLQRFCHAARDVLGARYAVAGIVDADGSRLRYFFTSGMDTKIAAGLGSPDPERGGPGRVLAERRGLRLRNPGGDPTALGFSAAYPPIRSWLGAPIVSPGLAYGWLGLIDKVGAEEFSEEDERLAGVLTAQVGRIYENGSLYHEVLQQAAELKLEVAERKQAEDGLRASEERYRLLFERNLAGVLVTSSDGRVAECNDAMARILGHATAGELTGQRTPDFWFEAIDREMFLAQLRAKGTVTGYEVKLRRKDGGCAWVVTNASLVEDKGQTFIQGTIIDVTERRLAEAALRDREEHIRLLLDSTAEAIYGIDLHGHCTFANSSCARLLGYADPSQFLGKNMHELVHHTRPDGTPYPANECRIFQAFRNGEGSHVDDEVLWRADGSSFPAEYWSYPIRREGHLAGSVVMFLDVTGRKRAEETLRESEERFRQLAETINEVFWLSDPVSGQILYVSPAYETIWGQSCASLYASPLAWLEPIQAEDRERVREAFATKQAVGGYDEEYRIVRPDGSVRWIHDRGFPVRDAAGAVYRVAGVAEDITERKRAEAERDELLARLQVQISRMPLIYILFNSDFRVTDWNPAAERTLGYTRNEALGKGPNDLNPPSFHQDALKLMERIRAGDMAAHSVNENRTKDGRTITCEWFNTPLLTDDGRFGGLLCLGRDVTEQRSLEAQLRQAQKMEAVGQLAGGVAHDFNNLLTIINGYGELLAARFPQGDPTRELLGQIVAAGDRAAGLTRQLLAFSRKAIIEPRTLDLKAVVADVDKMLRRIIGEDIQLSVVTDPDVGTVKADPGQVEQVIVNLVVNARDAMPRGGKVTIELHNAELDETYARDHLGAQSGPHVLLAVSDTGSGMDRETMARIFEPFFSTKGERGTGLGLATVHGIVKQSDGHVAVYSEVGHGTTFKVYLPRAQQRLPSGKSHPGLAVMPRGGETVLLVEDEDGVRALARHILQGCGYTVLEARDGAEALRLAGQHQGGIDLLVTDVVMPRMSGREVAERLAGMSPRVKVLFLSGYTDDAVVRHGILEAEVSFLQKPYSPASLAAKVREVLDGQ
jgi:two-component system cell cycle sensor histidine kinase/response regulator CckA